MTCWNIQPGRTEAVLLRSDCSSSPFPTPRRIWRRSPSRRRTANWSCLGGCSTVGSTIIGSNEDEGFHLRRVRHQNALPRRHTEPPGRKDRRRPAVSSHGWWVRGGVFPRLLISAAFSLQRSLQHLQTWGETEVGGFFLPVSHLMIDHLNTTVSDCLSLPWRAGHSGRLWTLHCDGLSSSKHRGSGLVIPTRRNHFSVVAHPVM